MDFCTISDYIHNYDISRKPILTGWTDFDVASGGFHNGELTVFGGRPATGKTDLLIMLAHCLERSNKNIIFLAPKQNLNVLVHKFELFKERPPILMSEGFTNGTVERIHLCMKYKINVEMIDEIIAEHKKTMEDCLFIIDNFTSLETEDKFQKEHTKIQFITQELKKCTHKYNIPIITSVGLNRNVDYRMGAKTPYLSDLRGSGEIEELADKVGLLSRPENYGIPEMSNGSDSKNCTELNFVKNSYGTLGSFLFYHHFDDEASDSIEFDFDLFLNKIAMKNSSSSQQESRE